MNITPPLVRPESTTEICKLQMSEGRGRCFGLFDFGILDLDGGLLDVESILIKIGLNSWFNNSLQKNQNDNLS